jgi:hypothetical protein
VILCFGFFPFSLEHAGHAAGLGLLHTIWWWRGHPGLSNLLKDVKHPTENNLHTAGLIPLCLSGTNSADSKEKRLTSIAQKWRITLLQPQNGTHLYL